MALTALAKLHLEEVNDVIQRMYDLELNEREPKKEMLVNLRSVMRKIRAVIDEEGLEIPKATIPLEPPVELLEAKDEFDYYMEILEEKMKEAGMRRE